MNEMEHQDPTIEELRDAARRRRLTPAELAQVQEYLRAHPSQREDWEQDLALTDSLLGLPDVPVASNFTARIMDAVSRGERPRARARWWSPLRWGWLPRLGFATVLLVAGVVSYQQVTQQSRRAAYAESVSVVSEVGPIPSAQALTDFDAIRAMTPTPTADEELLALMQ